MAKDENQSKFFTIWIIDSDASHHMILDKIIFISRQAIKISIIIANGAKLHAKNISNVKFDLDSQRTFIRKMCYVFDLDSNLFLILALNCNKLNVLFRIDGVKIRQEDFLVASEILRDKIYHLHIFQMALLSTEAKVKNLNKTKYTIDAILKSNI